jgi:hypothetical protein
VKGAISHTGPIVSANLPWRVSVSIGPVSELAIPIGSPGKQCAVV